MMLMRASVNDHASRRAEQTRMLRRLLEMSQPFGFLVQEGYAGCMPHDWVTLDSGYSACRRCGKEHWCCRSDCPEITTSSHSRVCAITGCVTVESETHAERDAFERIGPASAALPRDNAYRKKKKQTTANDAKSHHHHHSKRRNHNNNTTTTYPPPHHRNNNNNNGGGAPWTEFSVDTLHEMVEHTVRELMLSDKTAHCMAQERQRNSAKELSCLSRILRDVVHDRSCIRPNMVTIVAQVAFSCRKNRVIIASSTLGRDEIEAITRRCIDAIAGLLCLHGGARVTRHVQNATRCRELICSMLYLTRVGIIFQGRQILPRIDALQDLLPLQGLLPSVFHIRAKSITEGENLIKMDIKHLPLE